MKLTRIIRNTPVTFLNQEVLYIDMKVLTEKTRNILRLWKDEHNIQEMADITTLIYDKIRNNYFKHFWRKGYLNRNSKGRYILNSKGKLKINQDLNFLKSEDVILKLSKKKYNNKEIKKELEKKLNLKLTHSSIFTKVSHLRKIHKIKDRRIKEINDVKINKDFYEFLGLVLSDGYIGKYEIGFSNKDSSLISHYCEIINNKWNQKFYKRKRENGLTEISIYSIKLVNLVNEFLNNKKSFSDKIMKKENYYNSFLRGLFSGDGCIAVSISYRKSKEKWRVEYFVSLAVFNDKIIPFIIRILKIKGYNLTFNKNYIFFHKKEDIKKFYEEIKFIEGVKIRKSNYWNGFEKNKVLDYIANNISEDYKLKELVKENDKENIINHIKEQII